MKKKFYVFEGIDGSGKSTLIEALQQKVDTRLFYFTKEPGGTNFKDSIKELLKISLENKDPYAQYLLFAAERTHHIKNVILPKLKNSITVISDRFFDSSLVYQSEQVATQFMKMIFEKTNYNLTPTKTFFCYIDPQIAMQRIQERKKKDIFDDYFFSKLSQLQEKYIALYKNRDDVITLDMNVSINENVAIALKEISHN